MPTESALSTKLNLRLSENFYAPIKKLKFQKTQDPAVGSLSFEKYLVAVDFKHPNEFNFIFDSKTLVEPGYTRI